MGNNLSYHDQDLFNEADRANTPDPEPVGGGWTADERLETDYWQIAAHAAFGPVRPDLNEVPW